MVLSNPKVKYNQATLVLVNQEILPFSFLNYIFLNKKDFESQNIEKELFTHELTHVNQKHSLDILFVEILKTIFWFNPLLIIFKKAIQLNHEFICDEKVLQSNSSVVHYQNLLLSKSTKFHSDYLISNLNFKITKKRLLMMAKKTEKSNIVYKKIIASVCLTLLFIVSCQKKSESIHAINSNNNTTKTIREPQFKGGMDAFFKFIGENYKIPTSFKGKGKVNMKFMVEKDGSLSDFIIEKETNSGIGAEAIRVLKTCPKWIPATENGKNIRVQYSLPITIQP